MGIMVHRGVAGGRGAGHGIGPGPGVVAGLVLLLLGIFPSCQGKAGAEPVAVTIGSRQITLGEFERALWAEQKKDRTLTPDTAGVRRFLPVLEDKVIWEELAREEIPELEPVPRMRVEEFIEQKVVETLRQEAYLKEAQPGDDRVRRAYETLGRKLHLRYIKLASQEEAEEILQTVRQGAVFAKVAENKSLDESSRVRGGDIGWITYYDLDPEIRDRVFALRTGDIGGPYAWSGAWQLFQVTEEGTNEARGPLERERARLSQGLAMSAVIAGRSAFVEGLFRKYKLRMDPAEVAWMTALLREKTASVPRDVNALPRSDPDDPDSAPVLSGNPFTTPPVSPTDTSRVVATYEGPAGPVPIYPILVVDQLLTDAPISWPRFEQTSDVENLIRELVLERLEIQEAVARRIGERPEIRARAAEEERKIRARFWYRTRLRPQTQFTPEEARAYYDAHPEEFQEPEKRRFVALNTASRAVAEQIRERFARGESPTAIKAALASADATLTGTGDRGTPMMSYGQSPLLDAILFRLPAAGVSTPIPVQGRYTVARVEEIAPAWKKSYEEVAQQIQQRTSTARTDALLREKIEAARPRFPVQVDWQVLDRVRPSEPVE